MKAFIIYLPDREHSVKHSAYMLETLTGYGIDANLFEGIKGDDAVRLAAKSKKTLYPFSIKNQKLGEREIKEYIRPELWEEFKKEFHHTVYRRQYIGQEDIGKLSRPGVVGCFYSHYALWNKCIELGEPIMIFEDEKIEQVIEAISRIKFFYDLEENYKYIVVIRDPYNLFASRAKKEEDLKSVGKNTTSMVGNLTSEAIELWKELAYEYLDNKSILKNKICVNYNLWSSCKKYRQKLAKKIGIYFTDEGFREVPVFGNGSSFDFMKYNGNAQNMKIHERYKEYSNCSWFKSIFDKETKELSQHIFKISPF